MYVQMWVGDSSIWVQALSLPSSCPWIAVSPVDGAWTYELLRQYLPSS